MAFRGQIRIVLNLRRKIFKNTFLVSVKSTRSHQVHQSKILADIRLNSDRGGRAEVRLSCQKEQGSSEGATTRKGFSVQVQTSGGGAALRTLQAWGLTLYIQGPWGFRVFRGRTGLPSSQILMTMMVTTMMLIMMTMMITEHSCGPCGGAGDVGFVRHCHSDALVVMW